MREVEQDNEKKEIILVNFEIPTAEFREVQQRNFDFNLPLWYQRYLDELTRWERIRDA